MSWFVPNMAPAILPGVLLRGEARKRPVVLLVILAKEGSLVRCHEVA